MIELRSLFRREKPLRMAWRVDKDGRRSFLVGTAHFFPHGFEAALSRLLAQTQAAIFEGPLDEASQAQIAEYGRQGQDCPDLAGLVRPEAQRHIDRLLAQRLDGDHGLYSLIPPARPAYFEAYTRGMRPWAAFFSIWSTCLGWEHSVDMEGYRLALKLGKTVHFLESLEEQLAVLDGVPVARMASQLNEAANWGPYQRQYVRAYQAGDLDGLIQLTARFATRGAPVIGRRDQVLFARSQAIFEHGPAVAFLGFPHVPGVIRLLQDAGYRVTQEAA